MFDIIYNKLLKSYNHFDRNNIIDRGVMAERVNILKTDYKMDRTDLRQVVSAVFGGMLHVQDMIDMYVAKGQSWNVDFAAQKIKIGNSIYPIQFIGSESIQSNDWLWGWENINGFDESLLTLVNEAKAFGENVGFDILTVPKLPLTESVTGYILSMIACTISEKNCGYYPCRHSGGVAFVALCDLPESFFEPVNSTGFINNIMKAISLYELDHKILVEGFLEWNGCEYHREENDICATFENKEQLLIRFEDIDNKKRIKTIEGTVR